jgi:DNA repair exonuclease SbcCD ATPase subunit
MYISKLHLRAFGKFIYKKIYLDKKFNIIYGENETGKSTIHNFIESVLYGFGSDEYGTAGYEKYKPWKSNMYKGSLNLEDEDKINYLVSKDFLIGTTQVFNKPTVDSDGQLMDEENIKVSPGEYFFNINKISFRNTVSIRQLGNKTDSELANELKNKIINLSKSRDETISIDRILSSINSIKEEAGSEDNPKTLLGQYAIRLKELEEAKTKAINSKRQVMFLAMEKKKLSSKLQELKMRIDEMNSDITNYELSMEKERFLKAEPVKAELDEINRNLSAYEESELSKEFSDKDYEEAGKISSSLNSMHLRRNELKSRRDEAEEALAELEGDISNNVGSDFDIEKFNSDFSEYEANCSRIERLKTKISSGRESLKTIDIAAIEKFIESYDAVNENSSKIEIADLLVKNDKSYEILNDFRKKNNVKSFFLAFFGTAFIALAGLAGYTAYYFGVQEYYAGKAVGILGLIFYAMSAKNRKKAVNSNREMESIECQHADSLKKVAELTKENDQAIVDAGCKDIYELNDLYEKKVKDKIMAEEKQKLMEADEESLDGLEKVNSDLKLSISGNLKLFGIDEISQDNIKKANEIFGRKDSVAEGKAKYTDSLDRLNQELSTLEREISFEEKRLVLILNSNKMSNLDEFKSRVEYFIQYKELKERKSYCENILSSIIGKTDYDELMKKTKHIPYGDVREIDKKEHQLRIFELNEEKNSIMSNINNIELEINDIENSTRPLAEIEEEIDFYNEKKKAFNNRIKVAEIAADKISEISDSIKGDFMPLLRKSISDNFAYLTNGKYSAVNIDENMNITVVEEADRNRKIDIESLSGGTLDQLYLSLRISLSNILSGNQNIPVILDDSFVQYDSNRLKKSIEMLGRESERRQIILFTCQEREIEAAKQLNVKFNLIKL